MKSKQITVKLSEQVLVALDAFIEAKSKGETRLSYSIVIRDALNEYLDIYPADDIKRGGARPGAGRPPKEE